MSLLQLNTDGLFEGKLAAICPPKKQDHSFEHVRDLFKSWTQASFDNQNKTAIFSDYRKCVLERWGIVESKSLASRMREKFETLLVLGIGGSALGAKAVLSALSWSIPANQKRNVYFAENLDPIEFENIWSKINPEKTCFAIISKSGGTIETMAQTSAIIDRLNKLGLNPHSQFIAITDPAHGSMIKWATNHNVATLEVPPGVGGRFSVFSPVGIFPLAFAGLNVESLIEGATTQFQYREISQDRLIQLALRLAELENNSFVGHNLMSYSSQLKDLGAWYVQLWGESLGKTRNAASPVGMIPISSVGATDQHSLLQLLVEGPNRIVTGFIRIDEWPTSNKTSMGVLPSEFVSLSYAFNKSFGEILNAEEEATRQVLVDLGRPCYQIRLSQPSAAPVGALLAFYMDLCVLTGAAHNLDPFNQPGVELGKLKMPQLLGA